MPEPMISATLDSLEHHSARGGKSMIRALLAAIAGLLLAILYMLGSLQPDGVTSLVKIPWLDVEAPLPMGALAFLAASAVLGVAGAYHMRWVTILNLDLLDYFYDLMQGEESKPERQKLFSKWQVLLSKTSPFILNIYVIGATSIGIYSMHFITFSNLYIPRVPNYPGFFEVFLDWMLYALIIGANLTAAPFLVAWFIILKYRWDVRNLLQRREWLRNSSTRQA